MSQGLLIDVPAHNGVDDDNQRFTTREALEWVKGVAGVDAFDLDVAACVESHHAPKWYGQQVDGSFVDGLATLTNPWVGNVFCNPPWGSIGPWVAEAWSIWIHRGAELQSISMLLPGNRTHRPWWQGLVERYRDGRGTEGVRLTTHFAPKRFAYGGPGNPLGIGVGEPNFTSVALVWRRG